MPSPKKSLYVTYEYAPRGAGPGAAPCRERSIIRVEEYPETADQMIELEQLLVADLRNRLKDPEGGVIIIFCKQLLG